jgi:hypothetical protein
MNSGITKKNLKEKKMFYWVKEIKNGEIVDVTEDRRWSLSPDGYLYYFCEMTGDFIKTDEFVATRIY